MLVTRCLIGLLLLSGLVGLVQGQPLSDWTGVWETRWQADSNAVGGAVIYMQQTGDIVTGEYPLYGGTIQGQVRGRVLSGEWRQAARRGNFIFTLAPDGQSFVGRFGNGEWWTGGRRGDEALENHFITDLGSPQRALRSFLQAINWAIGSETFGDLDATLRSVDDRHLGEDPLPGERLAYTRDLFLVLDQLTFRLWSIPETADGDSLEVALEQVGTEEVFRLAFRYNAFGDGSAGWQILPPPPAQLQERLRGLAAYHGEERLNPGYHLQLRNPRDTMRTLLEELRRWQNGGREHVLRTLNLSWINPAIREEEGELAAYYLREVLDRISWVIWQEIPNDPESRVPYVHFRHPRGDIVIAPVETDDGVIWQFTPETLASLRTLYGAMEDMPPVSEPLLGSRETLFFQLRDWVRGADRKLLISVAGLELWQWIALVVILLLGVLLAWLLSWGLSRLAQVLRRTSDPVGRRVRFIWPARIALIGGLWLLGGSLMGLPESTLHVFQALAWSLLILSLTWLVYNIVDWLSLLYEGAEKPTGHRYEILQSLLVGFVKVAVLITGLLLLADVLAIPYEGLIAGLGVGGLAMALAARNTVENFIGGLTLFADKPLEVGDFCRFGDKLGTVEHIGLRSTRIRSLDRTVISIPNAEFVNLHLENFGRRDRMLVRCTLQLRYETTPDQLRHVLTRLRQLLIGHPRVLEDPVRVRLIGFGASSLDVEVFAYVDSADWGEFLGIREDLFLRIIDVVEESGSGFAFPSQTVYMARDGGLDAERRQAAEQMVADWRNRNQLPFPDMSSEGVEAWRSSLDFPPRGSFTNPHPPEDEPKSS